MNTLEAWKWYFEQGWPLVMGAFLVGLFIGVIIGWLIARRRAQPERERSHNGQVDPEQLAEIVAPLLDQRLEAALRKRDEQERMRKLYARLERLDE